MNQTKKRLSIIKTAISITDIETIQLQVLKLGLLKTDEKIQTIIAMLQSENYAQAQGLITTYIETASDNILQRSSQEKKHILTQEEQSTIDEFQLFVNTDENDKKEININDFLSDDLKVPSSKPLHTEEKIQEIQDIDINDFLSVAPLTTSTPTENPNKFDSLLQIDADDVLPDNIDINIHTTSEEDTFFALPSQEKKMPISHPDIPKDTFFDIANKQEEKEVEEEVEVETVSESIETTKHIPIQEINHEENDTTIEKIPSSTDTFTIPKDEVTQDSYYKAIPYIAQKLKSMYTQYPSSYTENEHHNSLTELLTKISQEPFKEEQIEETLQTVKELKDTEQFSEAMQLLLLSAATPSPFAQLILARELYLGILLTKNISQAFTLLNTLAMDDYPEALCDLGQFYENGIGTKIDKKRATELYKSAMDLGIRRAKNHFERMQKKKKGFFRK